MNINRYILRCPICRQLFSAPYNKVVNGQRYCSSYCRHKADVRFLVGDCEACGKKFQFVPSRLKYGGRKYCSLHCFRTGPHHDLERRLNQYLPPEPDENGHRLWQGYKNEAGYGILNVKGIARRAHRLIWTLANGPIPDGMEVLHNCPGEDLPACCSLDHLYLGTQKENMRDLLRKRGLPSQYRPETIPRGSQIHGKLNDYDIIEIRRLLDMGLSQYVIADQFKVNQATIWAIKHRRIWKHVP